MPDSRWAVSERGCFQVFNAKLETRIEIDEWLSYFASGDTRDAMEITAQVGAGGLNASGQGCNESRWLQHLAGNFALGLGCAEEKNAMRRTARKPCTGAAKVLPEVLRRRIALPSSAHAAAIVYNCCMVAFTENIETRRKSSLRVCAGS